MASIASEVIREIRENPEVREEVRRLILTDELLAMPALLARVDARQDQMAALLVQQGERLDRVDARQDRMEETQRQIAELLARQDARFDRMDARFDRVDARQDRMEETQGRMEETQGRMDARQDRMEETQSQIVTLLARMDARQGPDGERSRRHQGECGRGQSPTADDVVGSCPPRPEKCRGGRRPRGAQRGVGTVL